MRRILISLTMICLFLGISFPTNATLYDRENGMIYDSDQDITWLQDANYAKTTGYSLCDEFGRLRYADAVLWVDQLVYGGYTDWRLPKAVDDPYVWGYDGTTTAGYNIITSEMGYMFYVNLGSLGEFTKDGVPQEIVLKTGPFYNIIHDGYGSGTLHTNGIAPWDPPGLWVFNFGQGYQDVGDIQNYQHIWAVRDGDVAPIPEPATMVLLGSGLIGILCLKKNLNK